MLVSKVMGLTRRYIHHHISTAQAFDIVVITMKGTGQTWFIFLLIEILSLNLQQRVKSVSSAEHMKVLAVECSNSDTQFQQLDKLRMIYEEYVKLGKESIPLAQRNIDELTEDLNQKNQEFDDVNFFLNLFLFILSSMSQLSIV